MYCHTYIVMYKFGISNFGMKTLNELQVYSFLGVSPPLTGHAMTELTYRNVNEWIKSTEYRKDFIMPKNTRNVLNNFFEPYNKMLSRLLKDDRYTWKDIQY